MMGTCLGMIDRSCLVLDLVAERSSRAFVCCSYFFSLCIGLLQANPLALKIISKHGEARICAEGKIHRPSGGADGTCLLCDRTPVACRLVCVSLVRSLLQCFTKAQYLHIKSKLVLG